MSINKNSFTGIVFLIFGLILLFIIPLQIPEGTGLEHGPRLFPIILSFVIIISSIGLLIHETRIRRIEKEAESVSSKKTERYWKIDLMELLRGGTIFAMMWVYILILDKLGFIISSLLFVVTSLIFYKTKNWTHYVAVIVITIIIYYVFTVLLETQLP